MELKTLALTIGDLKAMDDPPALYGPSLYSAAATRDVVSAWTDGNRLWVLESGIFVPLNFTNRQSAPKVVSVAPGDKLQIILGFDYTGPAVSGAQAYFAWGYFGTLGNWAPTQEIWVSFNIPANPSSTPVHQEQSYTFTIPGGVSPGLADILVQVNGGSPDVGQHDLGYNLGLNIVGATASITNFTIKDFAKV